MKHNSIARDAVDQQPVRIHMALDESGVIILERRFSEYLGQRFCRVKTISFTHA
jgi:hypothetical protein